jgi:ubiquinol-cytochrome c reductase cytochrome b subunit
VFVLLWPFIEAQITGDRSAHDVLDRPIAVPLRAAVGAALLFDGVLLTLAAADDQTAATLHLRLETLVWAYRVLLVLGPLAVGLLAARIAAELRARAPGEREVVSLVRNDRGGYDAEEPQPV